MGLPAQQADQIFTAFFTTKPHGTGMGLSISRSIIESHGGALVGRGQLPAGPIFLFQSTHKSRGARMTLPDAAMVFVVDDDASVRASIQGLLKSARLRCASFATAEEFLRYKLPDGPRCMVLDVSLPGVSGLEFQRQLADAGVQIPIIFITGHGDIPMSVKAIKSGAVEFLTKPFQDQDLLNAIRQALHRDRVARHERSGLAELQKRYSILTARE